MHPEGCSLPQNQNRWIRLLASCNSRRKNRRSAWAAAEHKPCFQRARRERSKPSGVRGPVLAPPCIRQRPLRIAGARHFSPCRVLAPHRGAVFGSPGGLPFFSHSRRASWGLLSTSVYLPGLVAPGLQASSNHGLPTVRYLDVLNHHSLLAPVRIF